jgi:hypothetical protein
MTRTPIPATSGTSEGEEPVPSTFTGNFGTTTGAREVQYNGNREREQYVTTSYQGFDGLRIWNRENMMLLIEAAEHLQEFADVLEIMQEHYPHFYEEIRQQTPSKVSWWLKRYERQRTAANTPAG